MLILRMIKAPARFCRSLVGVCWIVLEYLYILRGLSPRQDTSIQMITEISKTIHFILLPPYIRILMYYILFLCYLIVLYVGCAKHSIRHIASNAIDPDCSFLVVVANRELWTEKLLVALAMGLPVVSTVGCEYKWIPSFL